MASNKILIVDREPDILKSLEILLTERGYQVKGVTNSEDAIENFRHEYFDLVITEIRIPRLGGNNLIRRLKDFDEQVEIIVLTGFSALDSARQVTQDKCAFAYLTKPLEHIDQLYMTVSQAIEKRNACQGKRREK